MIQLLSKDHWILEKGVMEFHPYMVDLHWHKIRDVKCVDPVGGYNVQVTGSYER